jgi:hypothetical protein
MILRDAISDRTGRKILVTKHTDPGGETEFIMRYGNPSYVPSERIYNSAAVLGHNTPSIIHLCSNKMAFSNLMEKSGILSPVFHSTGKPLSYPALIRTTLVSYGGKGIIPVNNETEFDLNWKPGYFWTEFYNLKYEYRVHMLGGQIGRIFKKVKEDGTEDTEYPIRNVNNGYHFSLQNASNFIHEQVTPLVSRIFNVLPASYCALDIGYVEETDQYVVLEGNSGPGLTRKTAAVYADYLTKVLFQE